VKAYGKALPDDEIKYITGRAIPPEWTVHLLALVKEPWKFKDVNYQLDTYLQQWQSDQQKQMMIKMAGTTVVVVAVADTNEIMDAEVADGDAEDPAEIMTTKLI
jgi:hypothetical protein